MTIRDHMMSIRIHAPVIKIFIILLIWSFSYKRYFLNISFISSSLIYLCVCIAFESILRIYGGAFFFLSLGLWGRLI